MKLRVEYIPDDEPEELVLHTHRNSDRGLQVLRSLEHVLDTETEMILTLGDTEYYVPRRSILFFETVDGKVTAHTAKHMYYTSHKLYELESLMPSSFVRVSKSCILNAAAISALSHNLTGDGRVAFRGTDKIVYVSRSYYKILKEKIYDMRFRSY